MSRFGRYLDSVISDVAPQWGLRRLAARRRRQLADESFELFERYKRHRKELAAGGFQSAEKSRDGHSWMTSRLSPDSALEEDRPEMIERADSSYKNYELATEHVEGRVIRVAGTGMTVDPNIVAGEGITAEQAARWNDVLRTDWERWSEMAGRRGEALWQIQQLMQRYDERRGEWFILIGDVERPLSPNTLAVQVWHPDTVSTPIGQEVNDLIRMGVEMDENGDVIAYHKQDSHPGNVKDPTLTWSRYERFFANGMPRVLHHYTINDEGQHRGYPRMQVGTKRLKNAEEYDEAELERNLIAACFAAFIRSETDPAGESQGVVTDNQGNRIREITPGMLHYIGETDSVETANPSGPQQVFKEYMEYEGRMFAAGAGSPYEMLAGDWRGLPYNGARIVWNREEATVDVKQKAHGRSITWIYRHFVTREILNGAIDVDQVAYRSNPWPFWEMRLIPPARASLDPPREDRNELVLGESRIRPISDFVERKTGKPARQTYERIARDMAMRELFGFEPNLPNMGRDGGSPNSSTQPGDTNQPSSDANEERQVVGDVEET